MHNYQKKEMNFIEASEIVDYIISKPFQMTHKIYSKLGDEGSYKLEYQGVIVEWMYHYAIDLIKVSNLTHYYEEDGSDKALPLYDKIASLIRAFDMGAIQPVKEE